MLVGSPMLKLVKETGNVFLQSVLQAYLFTYLFLSVTSLIYEEGC